MVVASPAAGGLYARDDWPPLSSHGSCSLTYTPYTSQWVARWNDRLSICRSCDLGFADWLVAVDDRSDFDLFGRLGWTIDYTCEAMIERACGAAQGASVMSEGGFRGWGLILCALRAVRRSGWAAPLLHGRVQLRVLSGGRRDADAAGLKDRYEGLWLASRRRLHRTYREYSR